MKKLSLGLLFLVGAAQSQALIWGFSAPIIDGTQEVPPTPSNAYGSGSFTLDDQTWTLTGSMTVTGLPLTSVTGSHIHIAPPGVNGPVVFDLIANSIGGFPQQSGNITIYAWSGTLQDHGTIGPRATILARLIANEGYVNVHSQTFPGGEIRGHIECNGVVPEPATIAALSVGALALLRRRKR
jgi:hypothetical protein